MLEGRLAAQRIEQLAARDLGLRLDVEAGDHERHRVPVTTDVVDRDLERVGRRLAANAGHEHPVRPLRRQLDAVEASHHIRVDVAAALNLIEKLCRHGADRHQPPAPRMLGDDRASVLAQLRDRKAELGDPRDLREKAVVPAGGLRAALDDVAGDDRARQPVPVVASPTEAPRGRANHERRIGHPRADDDVRS